LKDQGTICWTSWSTTVSGWSYFYQPYEEHVKNLIGKYQENKEVLKVLKIEEAEILMFKNNPEANNSISCRKFKKR